MTMLNGRLLLHGVDAETLARKALDDTLRTRSITLDTHRYEDALSELIATAWELAERYQGPPGAAFRAGCDRLLRLRFVDWLRRSEGRTTWAFSTHTYERATRPVNVNLEDFGRLGFTLAPGQVDTRPDSDSGGVRPLLSGGRKANGANHQGGIQSPGRPGRGDPPKPVRRAA